MKTFRSHLSSRGFTLIEVGVLGSALLIILAASFLLKNQVATNWRWSQLPINFPLITTPTITPEPTASLPTTSQPSGNYQYLPQVCLQDLKSEDCKTQFKALLDEKCGGKLRNEGCEAIRQEIFSYASERVCQAKFDSGACKCLQTKDFQSQVCKDAIQELINKIIEGVCQPDPQAQVCQCLQDPDFQSQTCKDAYFDFLMEILRKKCQQDATLPACKCVDAPYPKLCLVSIKK